MIRSAKQTCAGAFISRHLAQNRPANPPLVLAHRFRCKRTNIVRTVVGQHFRYDFARRANKSPAFARRGQFTSCPESAEAANQFASLSRSHSANFKYVQKSVSGFSSLPALSDKKSKIKQKKKKKIQTSV